MPGDHDLVQRLRFLKINDHERATLRALRPFLSEELPGALSAGYDQLRAFPDASGRFRDAGMVDQAHAAARRHWDTVSSGDYDDRYATSVAALARAHAKSGIEPRFHIEAAALVAEQLVRAMVRRTWPKAGLFRDKKAPSAEQVADSLAALIKAVMLDTDFVVSAHLESEAEEHAKAQQALTDDQQALLAGSIGLGLERMSEGELQFRLNDALPEPYEKLREDFNDAIGQWHEAISSIDCNTRAIRAGAAEISSAADDLSRRTEQQAASLEQTAAALDEITATVKKTADGADHARDVVSHAKADAERGGAVVREAISAMSEIEASSRKVSQIIGVIDEIAFQTNLLALNAGVEAARAGDAGRGFAVVASEVRALAQRSAEAAREIKALISASSAQVGSGVKLVGETGQSLERIVAQVADINGVVAEIAASAKAQATGLQEVNGAVNQMDQVTQQNAAMVEQSNAASHALAQEAEALAELLRGFRIGRPERVTPPARATAPTRIAPPARAAPPNRASIDAKASAFVQRYAAPHPDHDEFGLNQSKFINVIDSKGVEWVAGGKPLRTFPQPALRAPGGRGLSTAARPEDDWEEF